MDNSFDHIDSSFKERFEGLKDHSVDPNTQWAAFEPNIAISGTEQIVGQSVFSSLSSTLGMAASVAGLVAMSGVLTGDAPRLEPNNELKLISIQESTAPSQENLSSASTTSPFSLDQPELESTTTSIDIEQDLVLAYVDESAGMIAANTNAVENQFISDQPQELSFKSERNEDHLSSIPMLAQNLETVGLINDGRTMSSGDLEIPDYARRTSFYVRGGFRVGNGESNSSAVSNATTVNAIASVGIAHSFTSNTFITVEAGYLKRSGNGIERSQPLDIDPVISAFTSPLEGAGSSLNTNEFSVRRSLVATEMSYLHVPVQVHVVLNQQMNASVGFYADQLLSVQNETYTIYNGEDYIQSSAIFGDEHSAKGLNDLRLGLLAGFQRSISSKFILDVRGMLPITSSYDSESEYDMVLEPNQLVDLQIGLIYKI